MTIPFITYREEVDSKLCYFIVQKDFPHLTCEISEIPKEKIFKPVAISKYNLWITFIGSLRGNSIPSYKDIDKEILSVMEGMALWFFNNRIIPNESRYKKWKINQNQLSI